MQRRRQRLTRSGVLLLVSLAVVSNVAANRPDGALKQSSVGIKLSILCDGVEQTVRSAQTTVGAVLKDAGIDVGPTDRVLPDPGSRPTEGMQIRVVRVVERTIVEKHPVAHQTIRKPTANLRPGLVHVQSEGKNGEKLVYYSVRFQDGVETKREVIRSEIVTPPEDRVILIGQQGVQTSRGFVSSRRIMKMVATAYDPGPKSCGPYADGFTSIGMRAGFGVVAVDPRVIPLRSRLYVEGYGFAIAGDIGRAIKGNRIDLGYDTYAAAKRFGRRTVTVHLLK